MGMHLVDAKPHAESSTVEDESRKRKQQDDGAVVSEFKRLALDEARTSTSDFAAHASDRANFTDENVQTALDRAEGPEWSKQWLRETRCEEYWGFAKYFDTADIQKRDTDFENLEDEEVSNKFKVLRKAYQLRLRDAFDFARERAGYPDLVWQLFRLQGTKGMKTQSRIEREQRRWETQADKAKKRDLAELEAFEDDDLDDDMDLEDDELRERDDLREVKERFLNEEGFDRYEDDTELRAKFIYLRKRFKLSRTQPRPLLMGNGTPREGLVRGMLENTLIVIDGSCANSHHMAATKYGWVFAVDPDYEDPGPWESLASKVKHQYRGFVRVRLEHLMNEFFAVRRYHALDRPVEALWREAQQSGNGLFVPTDP